MRDYIQKLQETGALRTIRRSVDPAFELAAVTHASQASGDQAVLFEAVGGTGMPVASNLYGSHRRLCDLIGAPDTNFCAAWSRLMDAPRGEPILDMGADDDTTGIALSDLPHITWHGKDAGPYITAGIVLARHPETGVANLSFHRTMHVSDTELRLRIGESHDLAHYMAAAEAAGSALDIAILIGPAPEIFLAACASLPVDTDEFEAAARIRGAPIPMRACDTSDLSVPADTEIVIEGRILPGVRRAEAPFGEFMGYYVPEGQNHVMEVTAVRARPEPIYHGLLCGSPEDMRPLEAAIAARIYRHLKAQGLPGILDVSTRPRLLNTVVRIEKQSEDHPRAVIEAAYDAHPDYSKACIVVDADVDIHDMEAVWWSFLTRGRADTRVHLVADRAGFYRDPKGDHLGRVGIDATMPLDRRGEFELKSVPGAEDVKLEDYVE